MMKKIVPFKKDIPLNTTIAGINSISLEHNLEKTDDTVISGEFIISGTYKMTPSSINVDNFEYKLPVNITIDKKYVTNNIVIDINDFYYEVINDKILSINIEVVIDNLEERTEPKVLKSEKTVKENLEEEINEDIDLAKNIDKEINVIRGEENQNVANEPLSKQNNMETLSKEDGDKDEGKSIFDNLEDNDNYVVYKIHVVTENDTIESIIEEYQTNREVLDLYNDLADLKIGDKIIIADNGN